MTLALLLTLAALLLAAAALAAGQRKPAPAPAPVVGAPVSRDAIVADLVREAIEAGAPVRPAYHPLEMWVAWQRHIESLSVGERAHITPGDLA